MPLPERLSTRTSCVIRSPAWRIGLLFLLPVLGLGAEEQGPSPRSIIGGELASIKDYPFMVLVDSELGFCSGTIIAPTWVLTAGHCVVADRDSLRCVRRTEPDSSVEFTECAPRRKFQFSVWFPYLSLGRTNEGEKRLAKRTIVHPNYSTSEFSFDVALIELEKPFPASFTITPAAIADQSATSVSLVGIASQSAEERYAPSGAAATMLGFGYDESGSPPGGMRFKSVNTKLHHAADCRNRFSDLRYTDRESVDSDVICAGTTTRRGESGDSGGPLIVPYSAGWDTKYLQVGVIIGSGSDDWLTPLTQMTARTSSYSDWIRQNTQGAVSPIVVTQTPAAPDPPESERLTNRLSAVEAQIRSLQTTVRSLQSNRALLKRSIDQLKDAEGQDRRLQTTEDGILSSASTTLAQ